MVKICGLSTDSDVDAALGCGADLIGFVFFPKSPRHVSIETAARLSAHAGGRAAKVLLTVNAADTLLAPLIEAMRPQILQLHGSESPDRVRDIKTQFGIPVMKAIGISDRRDLLEAARFEMAADFLLFDAKPPKDASLPGGNGACFDWTLLAQMKPEKPWFLAGGLDSANVGEALRKCNAPGVDVSSGVEAAAGVKDSCRIGDFVRAVRRVEPLLPVH